MKSDFNVTVKQSDSSVRAMQTDVSMTVIVSDIMCESIPTASIPPPPPPGICFTMSPGAQAFDSYSTGQM